MSCKPLTKKEWESSVADVFSLAVKSTYQGLIDEAVLAERAACLEDVKKVFAVFETLPKSAEKKMLNSVTSIFIESIREAIEQRAKS